MNHIKSLFISVLFSASIFSQIPAVLHFQSFLRTNGIPFNGNAEFIFQIYSEPAGGTLLWTSTNSSFQSAETLSVSGGVFNYLLGSKNPLTNILWTGNGTFLQTIVKLPGDSWSNFTSRVQFLAVPYSFAAQRSLDSNPVGTVLPYYGFPDDLSRSYNNRYLFCDGKTIGRTNGDYIGDQYYDLYIILYRVANNGTGTVMDAKAAWNNGIQFSIPDMRGRFLRGTDNGAGRDSSLQRSQENTSSQSDVGSVQADNFGSHSHEIDMYVGASQLLTGGWGSSYTSTSYINQSVSGSPSTTSKGGTETRPKNVAVNYIIKY